MRNRSSAFGVPLAFARFPVKSASALIYTLPKAPGRKELTLGDGSEDDTEDLSTTDFVSDEFIYSFTC